MNRPLKLKLFKFIGLILVIVFIVSRCTPGTEKWKEEVLLSNSKVIVVERQLEFESGGDEWASNPSGSKPKQHVLKFTMPDKANETVEWHSIKKDSAFWPEFPLVLDVENGKYVVFSSVFNPGGCQLYSKYIYQNDVWVEEKLPKVFEPRKANLYIYRNEGLSYIDLNKKSQNLADSRVFQFVQVGPTHPNCIGL